MLFLIYTTAKPGSEATIRALHRAHRAYMEPHAVDVYLGGPILDGHGARIGGILVMEFEDYAAAKRFAFGQPYAEAGIIDEIRVHPFVPFLEKGSPTAEMSPVEP